MKANAGGRLGRCVSMLGVALACALLQACVFAPRTIEVYDAECQVHTRQMVLEAGQVQQLGSCQHRDCIAQLAVLGVVGAASAVISGSIVVAGNIVYWLEKQGRCQRAS